MVNVLSFGSCILRNITGTIATLALIVVLAGCAMAQTPEISYIYDELGRLVAVVDPTGDTAIYAYDAVGNLLSITRHSSSTVSVITFTPTSGPVATTVTIYGTAFSTTPSQNTVTFNGVSATVLSASATQIVTSVPESATSGLIGVSTPSGSATSSVPFVVGPNDAPTIAGFDPTIGVIGTPVTISGTNFESVAINNRVKFNRSFATIASVTPTSIVTSISAGTGSGRVTVRTPAGEAVGAADFIIPPTPYTAGDVATSDRMTIGGGSKTVSIGTASKIGLILFDGAEGQRVSLQISDSTFPGCLSVHNSINKPDGTSLATTSFCGAMGYLDTVVLPTAGTYTILIEPQGTNTGSETLLLNNVPSDITGTITPGGAPVTITTTVPGQNGSLTFSGTAGQRVSLQITDSTYPGCLNVFDTIKNPDGSNLGTSSFCGASGYLDTMVLPATGTYRILIDPQGVNSGTQTLTLNNVPADVTGNITPGGAPATVTTTISGQNGKLTFSATAGQRVSLQISDSTYPGCLNVYDTIKNPDGSDLATLYYCGSTAYLDTVVLPTTGTYSILIDPQGNTTGSQTILLHDVPSDATGTITVGGSSLTITTTVPGQNARPTFSGTVGQQITVRVTNSTMGTVSVSLLKPDGTALTSYTSNGSSSFDLATQTLPVTGTYTIRIDPSGPNVGSITLRLTDESANLALGKQASQSSTAFGARQIVPLTVIPTAISGTTQLPTQQSRMRPGGRSISGACSPSAISIYGIARILLRRCSDQFLRLCIRRPVYQPIVNDTKIRRECRAITCPPGRYSNNP